MKLIVENIQFKLYPADAVHKLEVPADLQPYREYIDPTGNEQTTPDEELLKRYIRTQLFSADNGINYTVRFPEFHEYDAVDEAIQQLRQQYAFIDNIRYAEGTRLAHFSLQYPTVHMFEADTIDISCAFEEGLTVRQLMEQLAFSNMIDCLPVKINIVD